jgi:Na+-driven multidrug efflux pump
MMTCFSNTVTIRSKNIYGPSLLVQGWTKQPLEVSEVLFAATTTKLPLLARRGIDDEDNDSSRKSSSSETFPISTSTASTASLIFGLAIPALVGEIIDPLLTLADTVFVGRFASSSSSTKALVLLDPSSSQTVEAASLLAGLGSASAILSFSFYLFNFLCTATAPLISRARAEAEQNDNGNTGTSGSAELALTVSGQALSSALVLGCIVTTLLLSFSQPLLYLMGTSQTGPDANRYATSFLTIRALAAPAVFLNSASVGILRGFLDTKTSTVILLAANIVNLTLDVLLIPVARIVPTTGAAVATTTAEWIAALTFLGILAAKFPSALPGNYLGSNQQPKTINNTSSSLSHSNDSMSAQLPLRVITPSMAIPNFRDLKPLLVASYSLFFRSICLQLFISGAAAMAARSTTTNIEYSSLFDTIAATSTTVSTSSSVAAHQIAFQLWVLCSFVCDALAAAAQALVADALGRDDMPFLRKLTQTLLSYATILGVGLAFLLQLGNISGFLLSFFTTDRSTQEALSPILNILIFSQPLNAIVFTADGILQGASQFSYQAKGMLLSVATATASFVALQHVIPPGQESTLIHVWQAFVILQIMRLLTSVFKLAQIIPV